jgi:hypothetical protein
MRITPVPSVIKSSMESNEDKQRQKGREERTEKAKDVSKAATIRIGSGGGGGGGIYTKSGKYEPLKYSEGGMISSASKRADGCAIKGKTKGKIV